MTPDQLRLLANSVRTRRNHLLQRSDWTQLPDSPVKDTDWETYRQKLRDLPEQKGFPVNIVWPEEPQDG